MTLRIFHSINNIKQIKSFPEIPEHKKINFQFKKARFNKLLIFDLDETLIHTVRDTEDMEEQQLMMLYNDMYGVEPDEWVDIMEPDSA